MMSGLTKVDHRTEELLDSLRRVYEGQYVLPDFQRDFVWPRDQITALLTSIFEGYYIGTFLFLDSSSKLNEAFFRYRSLQGVTSVNDTVDSSSYPLVTMVLDGQQRLTSLFYALYCPDVPLADTTRSYQFYIYLPSVMDGDIADSIRSFSPKNKKQYEEYLMLCEEGDAIPLSSFLDISAFNRWLYGEQTKWKSDEEKARIQNLLDNLTKHQLHIFKITRDVSPDAIVHIFERLNRSGIRLSVFDLATAHLFTKGIHLRDYWEEFDKGLDREWRRIVTPEVMLRVLAILNNQDPRTGKLLSSLPDEPELFGELWAKATEGVRSAVSRLRDDFGVLEPSVMPNRSMIVPLSSLLAHFAGKPLAATVRKKISTWYWISVMDERYRNSAETI